MALGVLPTAFEAPLGSEIRHAIHRPWRALIPTRKMFELGSGDICFPTKPRTNPATWPYFESFDPTQVATKGTKTAQGWTNIKINDFAPGPGTSIAGCRTNNYIESTQHQLLKSILRPFRGTSYVLSTNVLVLLCFASMAMCQGRTTQATPNGSPSKWPDPTKMQPHGQNQIKQSQLDKSLTKINTTCKIEPTSSQMAKSVCALQVLNPDRGAARNKIKKTCNMHVFVGV